MKTIYHAVVIICSIAGSVLGVYNFYKDKTMADMARYDFYRNRERTRIVYEAFQESEQLGNDKLSFDDIKNRLESHADSNINNSEKLKNSEIYYIILGLMESRIIKYNSNNMYSLVKSSDEKWLEYIDYVSKNMKIEKEENLSYQLIKEVVYKEGCNKHRVKDIYDKLKPEIPNIDYKNFERFIYNMRPSGIMITNDGYVCDQSMVGMNPLAR